VGLGSKKDIDIAACAWPNKKSKTYTELKNYIPALLLLKAADAYSVINNGGQVNENN